MISSNPKSMATTLTNGIAMFIPFVQESLSDRSMDRQLGPSTRASRTVWVTLKSFCKWFIPKSLQFIEPATVRRFHPQAMPKSYNRLDCFCFAPWFIYYNSQCTCYHSTITWLVLSQHIWVRFWHLISNYRGHTLDSILKPVKCL